MSDKTTTIQELKDIVERFIQEREWQQFHNPKNLSTNLALEAAELLEHFVWTESKFCRTIRKRTRKH